MTPEENLKNESLSNVVRGLTFEGSDKIKEITIDEKAEKPKRDLVRKRPV